MGEEVDIYSDLESEEDPPAHATTELDLLDTCVVPRQPTPLKPKRGEALVNSEAATRALEFSSVNGGPAAAKVKQRLSRNVCLEKEVAGLKEQNSVLKHNISILYATARHVLKSKDKEIATLRKRLDDLIFRRNNRGSTASFTNGTRSAVQPIHYVPKGIPEGKASTQENAEERKREMTSGLQHLYELCKFPQSRRRELTNVKQMSHKESRSKGRTKETEQARQTQDRRGNGSSSKVPFVNGSDSKFKFVRSLSKAKRSSICGGEEQKQAEENTRSRTMAMKRRRSRSPQEPCPRKVARTDHESQGHRTCSSSTSGLQDGHRPKMLKLNSSLLTENHCRKTSSKCNSVADAVTTRSSESTSDARRDTKSESTSKVEEESPCGRRDTKSESTSKTGDESPHARHDTKSESTSKAGDESPRGRRDTKSKSTSKAGDEIPHVRHNTSESTSKTGVESPRTRHDTKSESTSKTGGESLHTRHHTRRSTDTKPVVKDAKNNERLLSPLRRHRTWSLRSTVAMKNVHRRTSSDHLKSTCRRKSPDREKSRRLSDVRGKLARKDELSGTYKEDLEGTRRCPTDSVKRRDKEEGKRGSLVKKEPSKHLPIEETAEKDTEDASSGIEKDLEEGELMSD